MNEFSWVTEESAYKYLKMRWEKTQKEGFAAAEIDLPLYPIIPLFNRIPGVVTFMSCASHPNNDPGFIWSKAARQLGSQFYVSFGVTTEGANHLLKFFDLLQNTLDQIITSYDNATAKWFIRSGAVALIMHKQVEKSSEKDSDQMRWRGFRLTANLDRSDPTVRDYFLTVLQQTLVHYLTYYV